MNNTPCSQWEENIVWLQHNAPYLLRKVSAWQEDSTEVAVYNTDLGWNVKITNAAGGTFFLHSLYDREREYRKITANIESMHATVVLFGCAGGDFLNWLIKSYPHIKHLIIVEPSVKVFRSFMEAWSLQDILGIFPKVSLIIGEKQADVGNWLKKAVLSGTMEEKIAVIIGLVNYYWHYSLYEEEIRNALIEMLRFTKVNRNTVNVFRDLWLVNIWHNLKYGDADVADFQDSFRGVPAIIVSAGPSLDKNIHLLKKARDKALIVAVGSAISILHKKQILPHFQVALDPDPLNEKLFAGTYEDGVPLIYSNHLYYNILAQYKGPAIHALLASNSDIEEYLSKKANLPQYSVESGFSVANIAANILAKWKCKPIVFVGQDLAYTENRMHALGAWDNEFEERYIKKMYLRKDIEGNDVYSDPAFDGMRQIFERTIAHNPDLEFLNATEGGIPIKGAQNHKLAELLATWPEGKNFTDTIRNMLAVVRENGIVEERREKLYKAALSLKKDVEDFISDIRLIKKRIEKLLQKNVLTDKEARSVVRQIRQVQNSDIYQLVKLSFAETFALRREGYLKNTDELILPQVRLFYLEINDILDYLEKMVKLIGWYERGEEFKILFQGRS